MTAKGGVILEFELREKEVAVKGQFSAPAEVTSLTYNEAQRVLFGGTAAGGLFAVDADSLELRSLAQFKSAVNSLANDEAGEIFGSWVTERGIGAVCQGGRSCGAIRTWRPTDRTLRALLNFQQPAHRLLQAVP